MAKKGDKKKPPKKKVAQGHGVLGDYYAQQVKRTVTQSKSEVLEQGARRTEPEARSLNEFNNAMTKHYLEKMRKHSIAEGQKAARDPASHPKPTKKAKTQSRPTNVRKVKGKFPPKKAKPAASSPRGRLATAKKKQADKRAALRKRGAAVRAKRNKKDKK